MTDPVLVFVNDKPVRVTAGSTAAGAVAALDPLLAAKLADGGAWLTDGRGIRLEAHTPVFAGAIVRVVVSTRAPREEADAHP